MRVCRDTAVRRVMGSRLLVEGDFYVDDFVAGRMEELVVDLVADFEG